MTLPSGNLSLSPDEGHCGEKGLAGSVQVDTCLQEQLKGLWNGKEARGDDRTIF